MAAVQAAACQTAVGALSVQNTSRTQIRSTSSVLNHVKGRLRCEVRKPGVNRRDLRCTCEVKAQREAITYQSQTELKESTALSTRGRPRETRLRSVIAGLLPALVLAFVEAELPSGQRVERVFHEVMISESALKAFYMVFICVFSWGAVVFASMNDPFYESDEYRNAGGNGTQHWMYTRAEEVEQEAREELWREELRKEIEDKVGDVKELGAPEEEKEKTLV